jgi:hypothetical protein
MEHIRKIINEKKKLEWNMSFIDKDTVHIFQEPLPFRNEPDSIFVYPENIDEMIFTLIAMRNMKLHNLPGPIYTMEGRYLVCVVESTTHDGETVVVTVCDKNTLNAQVGEIHDIHGLELSRLRTLHTGEEYFVYRSKQE